MVCSVYFLLDIAPRLCYPLLMLVALWRGHTMPDKDWGFDGVYYRFLWERLRQVIKGQKKVLDKRDNEERTWWGDGYNDALDTLLKTMDTYEDITKDSTATALLLVASEMGMPMGQDLAPTTPTTQPDDSKLKLVPDFDSGDGEHHD